MAKKHMISISAEWNDLLDLLSFEESGKIFYLIRKFESLTTSALAVLEAGMELSNQAVMIWNSIKTELANMIEAKKAKSAKAAASARARWGTKEPAEQIAGQSEMKYVITSDSDRPEVHAPECVRNASVMRTECERNANASALINNNINNKNKYIYTESEIVKLFVSNGSTESEAKFYHRYYTKRNWITKTGKRITNLEASVKGWIRRRKEHISPVIVTNETTHAATYPVRKPGAGFHNFDQRQYNYDELLKQINGEELNHGVI